MSGPIYILAGGGTGGHLYPGLAVAEELLEICPSARIVFACSQRGVDRSILDGTGHGVVPQPVRPLPRGLRQVPGFLMAWWRSAAMARDLIADLRPAAVLGLGGFAAAPAVRAAHSSAIRTGLLNPDAVPGSANRYLARRAWAIFTQFESTTGAFPPGLRGKIRCVGCPIRSKLLVADRAEAVRHFGLLPDRKTLLVFGGSMLAASINHAVCALAGELAPFADTWQLLHVTGREALNDAAKAYAPAKIHARTLEYCQRMDLAYAAADLAICRGGASTVAELAATSTPAIILPYPHHRDRQQELNAAELVAAGGALRVADAANVSSNVAALRSTLLPVMADDNRLARMKLNVGSVARPHASRDVARWLAGCENSC